MSRKIELHDAHMKLPETLWQQAVEIAQRERTSVTALVVEGLTQVISQREDKKGTT